MVNVKRGARSRSSTSSDIIKRFIRHDYLNPAFEVSQKNGRGLFIYRTQNIL